MCVYKTWMHSTDIKGPLLVLPVDRRDRVQTLCPETVVLREPPSNKDATELLNLAKTLEKPQYNLGRAAVALRELVAGHPGAVYQLPPTPWLSEGTAPVRFSADTGSQTFAHLPDTSWPLFTGGDCSLPLHVFVAPCGVWRPGGRHVCTVSCFAPGGACVQRVEEI